MIGGSGRSPETLSSLYSWVKSRPASWASRKASNFNFWWRLLAKCSLILSERAPMDWQQNRQTRIRTSCPSRIIEREVKSTRFSAAYSSTPFRFLPFPLVGRPPWDKNMWDIFKFLVFRLLLSHLLNYIHLTKIIMQTRQKTHWFLCSHPLNITSVYKCITPNYYELRNMYKLFQNSQKNISHILHCFLNMYLCISIITTFTMTEDVNNLCMSKKWH